ncbi:MAG TPA: AsmA-like C-terminal domain-containing protein, partial [Candidatus Baltobacteraceae bacterium]|nr:AsmA-like C-terminal domain-containing protein [Candidatus Baltobacteraceae bacterium]
PRLDLTLQDAELDPLLRATSLDIPHSGQPRASGKVEVRNLADTFAASDGQAMFTTFRVQIGAETWSGVGPAELSWREGTVHIHPVRLHSGERELTIQGTVGEGGRAALDMSGRMPIAALPVDLPGIQPLGGTARGTIRLSGMLSAPVITGRLELAEGRFRLGQSPAPLESVQAQVDLTLGRVVLQDVRGRWAGGLVTGSGEFTKGDGRWAVRASVQVENSRLEQLGSGSAQQTTGALTASGTFTSRVRVEQDFWENLAGKIQVAARDGGMGRQGLIVRVLSLANLSQLFNIRDLDLSAQSIPYRQLTGDFTIERGIARTENCFLEARAFNASAVGKIDLASQYIEMEVAIKPFQTLNLLSEVPLAGWLLTGKERSLYSAFYEVSGPLANPNVRSLPVKDIDQNVFGIFKRVLRLPALLQGSPPE